MKRREVRVYKASEMVFTKRDCLEGLSLKARRNLAKLLDDLDKEAGEALILKISERIADDLFTVGGTGEEATRLVLEGTVKYSGAGWCKSALVDRVKAVLKSELGKVQE